MKDCARMRVTILTQWNSVMVLGRGYSVFFAWFMMAAVMLIYTCQPVTDSFLTRMSIRFWKVVAPHPNPPRKRGGS